MSVLLIGYDSNLSLGVLYCLQPLNCDVYLLTSNIKNAARFSRFLKKLYYLEDKNDRERIEEIVTTHSIDLIMPIDELETRNVKVHLEELSKVAVCSWATEVDMFDIGINKMKLAKFLSNNDIPCPLFASIDSLNQMQERADAMGYPVLIKPDRGSFGRMIRRFDDWEELSKYYIENEGQINDYILQPFIIGSDITCNVICNNGEIVCYTIQESPVKNGHDFSSNDILEFHDDSEVIDVISKMMKLLKWHGVACVDMRRDIRDNSVKILEINGRFWASVVSSYIRTGLNFPLIMVKLALGKDPEISKAKIGKQLSLKQVISSKLKGKGASFKDTKYISYLADPLARVIQVLKL
ncbi:ATP-grasp domain-containing protein [Pedobacter sp. LMG 31643]|nr:ATP-grasp domain-containing protein [Pedobacter foliorum]NRF38217.1 ATP-grasp domain-containing protein [Pedobacter foliorum]